MFKKIWFKFSRRVSLKILVLRTPRFGSSYPQGVRVPPVKNHCSMLRSQDELNTILRAHCVCDVIIACISRGTFLALVASIFLLLWTKHTLQLGARLYLTAVVYEDL